jgi:hypothetical protein
MDDRDIVERTAVKMIKVYRSDAARVAHELAEIAEECHHDRPSGEAWRDIADMIERLWPKP